MPQFTVPASFTVEDPSYEAAVESVQSALDFANSVGAFDSAGLIAFGADTPDSREVWVVSDTYSENGSTQSVHRTRESATAEARNLIEEYRNNSRVAGEIDGVLAKFDEAAKTEEGVFGAGDGSCVFWVEVCRFDVRG